MLAALDDELKEAKQERAEEQLALASREVEYQRERAERWPDEPDNAKRLEAALESLETARARIEANLLPRVRYSIGGLDMSLSRAVGDMPLDEIFSSKETVVFEMAGESMFQPSLNVKFDRFQGVTVEASADSDSWVRRVLGVAEIELRKGKPWWAVGKHPATNVLALLMWTGGFCLQIVPGAGMTILGLVVSLLAVGAYFSRLWLPGFVVGDSRSGKAQLSMILKWLFGTLATTALSVIASKLIP